MRPMLCVCLAATGAVAGEIEVFPLVEFKDFPLAPLQIDLLPEIEGEIVNTSIDFSVDVPEGVDAAGLTLFASVPLDVGGFPFFAFINLTGEDLGLSGSGFQTVNVDTDGLNGTIADPAKGLSWAVGFGTIDGQFEFFGPANGSVAIEYIPVPAPQAGLVLAALLVPRRRRR